MKTKTLFILYLSLIVFVIVITPFEARLLNTTVKWMYGLNFSEVIIFGFGLLVGFKSSN